ncbi:MAG: hypothetical protein RO257_15060 [Candidatus Kapabacteria bacterium]|nr:hypothetical protein [Candidatus Kapabacteria bacterium]
MTRPQPISENNTSHKIIEIITGLAVVWSFVIIDNSKGCKIFRDFLTVSVIPGAVQT